MMDIATHRLHRCAPAAAGRYANADLRFRGFGAAVLLAAGATVFKEHSAPLELVAVVREESALRGAHDIEIRDGLAFVAGKGGTIAIVDVRRPSAPRLLSSLRDPVAFEDAETVMPLGPDRLLVGARDAILFDVSDPGRPTKLGVVSARPAVDTISGFARTGACVFGANKRGHVFALDVSAPDVLRLVGTRQTDVEDRLSAPHDVVAVGGLFVVVSPEAFSRRGRPGRLAVFQIFDPLTRQVLPAAAWRRLGAIEHDRLAGANRVEARGDVVVVGSALAPEAGRSARLRNNVAAVDVSDPAQPRLRGSIDFPDPSGPNGLTRVAAVAFAVGGRTVQAIGFADPDAPREIACFTSTEAFPGGADDAHDLVVADGHLFVTAQTSHALVVLRLDPTLRRLATEAPAAPGR